MSGQGALLFLSQNTLIFTSGRVATAQLRKRVHHLSRSDESKAGSSGRVGVFQLTGDIHNLDSDQFFAFIIKDDPIVEIALAASRIRFLFEPDIERVDVILIVQPQLARGKADSPARGLK